MAYSLITNVDGPRDVLAELAIFANAQGWTVEYDNSSAATGNGGQIALSSGECHIAIGERSATENPIAVSGGISGSQDARLYMALANSINTGVSQYWNHPGSIVTSATDDDRIGVNDLAGELPEMHLFGDDESIFIVIRVTNSRYTSFGFGMLDNKGMSGPRVAYAISTYFSWYESGQKVTMNSDGWHSFFINRVSDTGGHDLHSFQLRIPDGFLDTSLGFLDGDVFTNDDIRPLLDFASRTGEYTSSPSPSVRGSILDLAGMHTVALPTTGGLPLWALPVIYSPGGGISCYLGEIPGVRYINIENVPNGTELEYGADIYQVFPVKQRGTSDNGNDSSPNYINDTNTYWHGLAIRKVE